jgi:ABC-type transport system involved in multi-copper enzyme maturation permease subunit
MSAQTGASAPSGPASSRLVDRARFRVDRLQSEPNPIWIRELRQSARLARTPVILTVFCVLMTLLIASIGGIVSSEESPATTGVVLFQVFFSLAYFVVTVVGPAVAANSIASEREGRTWEAVILTGLSPGTIARGKFLAAFTAIGMYVVMLAPVGALPFLFGGVTATETIVAFAFLFLISLLSVAFGLAISSKMASLRAAIVVTLLLIFPITIIAFSVFGWGLSYGAHKAWSGVAGGPPIWLPTAYERAPFDAGYVVFLLLLPVTAVTLPAWFLYEVTIANLTSMTDDRSTGLKRWFLVAAPALTVAAAVPVFAVSGSDRGPAACSGLSALLFFFSFCVFLFQGDPIGPSRRVIAHWEEIRAGGFRRFLGPGVMRSAGLVLFLGVGSILALSVTSLIAMHSATSNDIAIVFSFIGYALTFFLFIAGLGAFLRARSNSALIARVLLFTFLFAVSVGPWIIAAIAGLVSDSSREAMAVAAPSPFYVFVMVDAIEHAHDDLRIAAGVASMILWALAGLAFLVAARGRCAKIIAQHEVILAETDRILAAEDAAEDAARNARNAPPAPEAAEAAPDAPADAASEAAAPAGEAPPEEPPPADAPPDAPA